MVGYTPYVPNIEAWRKQYALNNTMESKKFYTIKEINNDTPQPLPTLQIVSPAAQVIEQAKSQVKRRKQLITMFEDHGTKRKHNKVVKKKYT